MIEEVDFSPEMESLFRRRTEAIPPLYAFSESLKSIASCADRVVALAMATASVRTLLETDLVTLLVNFELDLMAKHSEYVPPSRFGVQMNLVAHDGWELNLLVGSLTQSSTAASSISTYERDVIYGNVAGPPVGYTRYRIEGMDRIDELNPAAILVSEAPGRLNCGDVLLLDSEKETLEVALGGRNVALSLAGPTLRPFVWDFDRENLSAIRLVAADIDSSRIAYAPELLAQLESVESVPLIVDLTAHPLHFVRWHAIKALCALEPEEGIAALQRAKFDEHRSIRRAACESLDRYYGESGS